MPYDEYDETWDDHIDQSFLHDALERTGMSEGQFFDAHLEVFDSLPGIQEISDANALEMWESYVENMINPGGSHEEFFDRWGGETEDFDWEGWREAMGYD